MHLADGGHQAALSKECNGYKEGQGVSKEYVNQGQVIYISLCNQHPLLLFLSNVLSFHKVMAMFASKE